MSQPFNPTAGIPKASFTSKDSPKTDNATWFSTVQPNSPSRPFDDQTSPQADAKCSGCPSATWNYFTGTPIGNLDNDACLIDPPLIFWDTVTQRNYVVLDCFSSTMFENTIYYLLQDQFIFGAWIGSKPFWRRDDQIEPEANLGHGYDAGELCWEYNRKFGSPYKGTPGSIKQIIKVLLDRKADVSRSRTRDGGREIIGDLSDMIIQAMHWRDEGGLGYE